MRELDGSKRVLESGESGNLIQAGDDQVYRLVKVAYLEWRSSVGTRMLTWGTCVLKGFSTKSIEVSQDDGGTWERGWPWTKSQGLYKWAARDSDSLKSVESDGLSFILSVQAFSSPCALSARKGSCSIFLDIKLPMSRTIFFLGPLVIISSS